MHGLSYASAGSCRQWQGVEARAAMGSAPAQIKQQGCVRLGGTERQESFPPAGMAGKASRLLVQRIIAGECATSETPGQLHEVDARALETFEQHRQQSQGW